MASVGDWIFLTICLAIAGGIFWLAKGQAVQKSLDAQAQGLKARGISLSADGISVKTNQRVMTHDEYVEKSQASLARGQDAIKKHSHAFSHGPAKG
ncbi:hypothetical protein FA09DRAFT_327858 [Tilletiopsis washingtonensis]|uniref:Uncharacterized protein n=1 Tax=Tilletiopsis washingtonensis TaxID=58919 RepID=A0A316ZFY6_9BASI|nr:hypothetical protein FA09DRAFT_327858 [Tilletiopsis washingtonensis]PWO00422.1 hypothetical protein FA09DRAFT_327858 [Tilletiopsis washingtonensis]